MFSICYKFLFSDFPTHYKISTVNLFFKGGNSYFVSERITIALMNYCKFERLINEHAL